ncbi:MAG: EAL domain-containing protein [Rhodanobacteraceae bacterium]
MRRALDNGELRLAYQPVSALDDGRIAGVEALLRWRSHALGEIAPSQFIAHAENSGEIVRIGAWVIAQACKDWRAWQAAGIAPAHVAVNVSFRQFQSGTLLETVRAALREHALPPQTLELELTERALIEDASDAMETFAALKRLGVRLLIDDFGEGYSSLNYLRRFPLDGLKISHAFLQGVPDDPSDSAICAAIVRLAESLGLGVTAEGVETPAQREFLAGLHASRVQGYLYAARWVAKNCAIFWARSRRGIKASRLHAKKKRPKPPSGPGAPWPQRAFAHATKARIIVVSSRSARTCLEIS